MTWPVVNGMRSIEFGNPGSSREHLNALVLHGNKRATAGLWIQDYLDEHEPLETPGEELAMLDNAGEHVATLRVTHAERMRFGEVPDSFALAEAEGDQNAAEFRDGHRRFWAGVGIDVTDATEVATVYFELVWAREGA